MVLRYKVRMGASAPLLLLGLGRPLRVGADGVQRTRRDDPIVLVGGSDAAATNRGRTACGHTRQTTTTHAMQSQRRDHTLRERHNTDVRHGELFLGAVPPNPHILALRARFRTPRRSATNISYVFPEFYVEKHPPTRPESTPRRPTSMHDIWPIYAFVPEKNFIWTLSEKNFVEQLFFCDIIFFSRLLIFCIKVNFWYQSFIYYTE